MRLFERLLKYFRPESKNLPKYEAFFKFCVPLPHPMVFVVAGFVEVNESLGLQEDAKSCPRVVFRFIIY